MLANVGRECRENESLSVKFSREFCTEEEARAWEALLQSSDHRAWRTQKADGTWEVFWYVQN